MPPVAKDLDFSAKGKALGQASAKGARMLSGLHYAKYRQQLGAKCHRAGVELIWINPAYTPTIGAVKYAARWGWSVHAAAAGVIARRWREVVDCRVPARVSAAQVDHALDVIGRIGNLGDRLVVADLLDLRDVNAVLFSAQDAARNSSTTPSALSMCFVCSQKLADAGFLASAAALKPLAGTGRRHDEAHRPGLPATPPRPPPLPPTLRFAAPSGPFAKPLG